MNKISFIFQFIFKFILIFLITFIWVRYFVDSLIWSVVISLAVTAIIDILTRFISRKKQRALTLKNQERTHAANCFLSLCLEKSPLNFFEKLAKSKHNAQKQKQYILITHDDGEKVVLYPHLSFNELSQDDVVKILMQTKSAHAQKIVILCADAQKQCFSFIKNFDCEILILDEYQTYQKLYKPYDIFPEIKAQYKKEKGLAFKDLVCYSLNKSRAKGYFISALILIFSSFFVSEAIYYCIVASLLIIFALISLYDPFSRNANYKSLL